MRRKPVTTPKLAWDNEEPGDYLFSSVVRPNAAPMLTWGFILPERNGRTSPNTVRVCSVGDEIFVSLDTIPHA